MPYINIKITREGTTAEQKAELIKGATELLARVLNKNPKTTVVTIEEVDTDSWGIGGDPVEIAREKGEAQDAKIARLEADKEEQEKELENLDRRRRGPHSACGRFVPPHPGGLGLPHRPAGLRQHEGHPERTGSGPAGRLRQ